MKRFTHLEFDDSSNSPKRQANGEKIRDASYFNKKAIQYFLHADFELALRNYSRALEASSSFFDGWAGQIRMLIELGEYPEALVWSDKAMESFPEHPELLASKAVACLRDAEYDKARAYSDNSISKDNAGPRVWLARTEVLLQSKSRIAEDCLSKAVAMSGTNANLIRLEAGRLLVRHKRYSTAMDHLQQAVHMFPKSALAWYELGCCQAKLGFSQAEVSLEQSLHLRPLWNEAQEKLDKVNNRGFFSKIFSRLRIR
jgi:tetratricopeptide (TPR) repeat protein